MMAGLMTVRHHNIVLQRGEDALVIWPQSV